VSRGVVLHVCVGERRGIRKRAVQSGLLQRDHGLQGDAHAGNWHRQVSLLAEADIDQMRARGLTLEPGAFGENLVVQGLALEALGAGTRLRLGDAELEITQIGKVCHSRCAIYEQTGDCVMPRAGVFARVLAGGAVAPGTTIEIIAEVPRSVIQAAIVTVSDGCAAGTREDTAGPAVAKLLREQLGARVADRATVADEIKPLTAALREYCDRQVDLLVTVGGTGFGPRDVTPEATKSVIEREAPGLAEAMRTASFQRTPHALLQRGVCGIRGATLIVNLPGSQRAACENLTALLPALPHAVQLLRGDTRHEQ